MACEASTTISAQDIIDLKSDISTIDVVVESNSLTTITKDSKTIDTLTGRLQKLGFQPPIPYVASIVFSVNDGTKTVDESGTVYAPLPSALPFTTSGTFIGDDDARFFVIQGITTFQFPLPVDTYAAMDALPALSTGTKVSLTGDGIAGDWVVDDTGLTADVGTVRDWNNSVGVQRLRRLTADIDISYFGASPSATDAVNLTAIQAAFDWAVIKKEILYARNPGTYKISAALTIDSSFTFVAAGFESVIIEGTHTSGNVLEIGTTTSANGLNMEGFQLTGPQTLDTIMIFNKNGSASDTANCHFQDIIIKGASGTLGVTGISTDSHTTSLYERVIIMSTDLCWNFSTQSNNLTLLSCRFQSSNKWFATLTSEGIHMDGCAFQNQDVGTSEANSFTVRQSSVLITNPYFENTESNGLAFVGSGSDTIASTLRLEGGIVTGDKHIEYRGDNLRHHITVEGVRVAPEAYTTWTAGPAFTKADKVIASDGAFYIAVQTQSGNDPISDTTGTNWARYAGGGVNIISDADTGYYHLKQVSISQNIRDKVFYPNGKIIERHARDNQPFKTAEFSNATSKLIMPDHVQISRTSGSLGTQHNIIKGQHYTLVIAMLRPSGSTISIRARETSGGTIISTLSISTLVPLDTQEMDVRYVPFIAEGDSYELLMDLNTNYQYAYFAIYEGCVFPEIDLDNVRQLQNDVQPTTTADWPPGTRVYEKSVSSSNPQGWVLNSGGTWQTLPNA